jgi:DNA polymerase-3 subunit gamma/tau
VCRGVAGEACHPIATHHFSLKNLRMRYRALARKWRPRNFSEVVGQEHVVKALAHAIEYDRMHHAYLFTGTRGVGKTTIARILAKALNCEARTGCNPCGTCAACEELDEGRFVDLIEVDAASRTRVEDTRDLLENVQYAPGRGRYKIYLIDEVHMLSGHSFNALLKTLEEPPPHVKFLLATTDPQKIPVTVLSRCLQFNLKRLHAEQIRSQMERILHQEGVDFEPNGIRSLARAAEGSMRDGLSLLDQVIAHGAGRVAEADVDAMLGTVARQPVLGLLRQLAEGDAAGVLQTVSRLGEHTLNFADVLQQLLIVLHRVALAQWAPAAIMHDDDAEEIQALATSISAEDLQLFYQIGLIGQRDLPLAPDLQSGFEMVLLRMLAFRPAGAAETVAKSADIEPRLRSNVPAGQPNSAKRHDEAAERPDPQVGWGAASTPEPLVNWTAIIQAMGISGMSKELASNCSLQSVDTKVCILVLDPQHAQLRTDRVEASLEKALQVYFKQPLKLVINLGTSERETPAALFQRQAQEKQKRAELLLEQDENVRALKERFDAKIIPGSIQPVENP